MTLGAGAAVAPGVVIHVVLGVLFAFFLVKSKTAPHEGIRPRPRRG